LGKSELGSHEYETGTLSDVLPTALWGLKLTWDDEKSLFVCVADLKFTVSNVLFLYLFHIGLHIVDGICPFLVSFQEKGSFIDNTIQGVPNILKFVTKKLTHT
jgi:hypothetical protein